jgi:cyclophilin family peptidyl-prolyl cis-trans isomerase
MNVSRRISLAALVAAVCLPLAAAADCQTALKESAPVKVQLKTSAGPIVIQLDKDKAPISTANFAKYVDSGQYNGTVFHRVIDGFMIQGGGFDKDMKEKPTGAPIRNEADNGLKNDKYTVAMARTPNPHSATAQFFINVTNNDRLNYTSPDVSGWGYAVFGKVVEGQQVVDRIAKVPTTSVGMYQNVPASPVVIESAACIGKDAKGGKDAK